MRENQEIPIAIEAYYQNKLVSLAIKDYSKLVKRALLIK